VAYHIKRESNESEQRPPGNEETRTVETVCTLSYLSSLPKPIVHRSLEGILKVSQALLDKRKVCRILDKTLDSQTVVKLVEQLRQAILIYQVGPNAV